MERRISTLLNQVSSANRCNKIARIACMHWQPDTSRQVDELEDSTNWYLAYKTIHVLNWFSRLVLFDSVCYSVVIDHDIRLVRDSPNKRRQIARRLASSFSSIVGHRLAGPSDNSSFDIVNKLHRHSHRLSPLLRRYSTTDADQTLSNGITRSTKPKRTAGTFHRGIYGVGACMGIARFLATRSLSNVNETIIREQTPAYLINYPADKIIVPRLSGGSTPSRRV